MFPMNLKRLRKKILYLQGREFFLSEKSVTE